MMQRLDWYLRKPRIRRLCGRWVCVKGDPYAPNGHRVGFGETPTQAFYQCQAQQFQGMQQPNPYMQAMMQPPQEGGFADIFFG
jgi:hypothetical protein